MGPAGILGNPVEFRSNQSRWEAGSGIGLATRHPEKNDVKNNPATRSGNVKMELLNYGEGRNVLFNKMKRGEEISSERYLLYSKGICVMQPKKYGTGVSKMFNNKKRKIENYA